MKNGLGRLDLKPAQPVAESRAFGPSFGHLVIALLLVAGGIAYWATLPAEPAPGAAPPTSSTLGSAPASNNVNTPPADVSRPPVVDASAVSTARAASAPVPAPRPEARVRDPNGDQTPDLRDYLNPGENPTLGEVINRLHQAGVYTGIGAFNPPNTRPRLVGLAVPEGFVLPDGYVRHYQATDDGQPIEPILMYAPDRPVYDTAGRPIAVPPNRVVPPEMAPPGLPLRRIVIPAALAADKSSN